MDCTAGNIFFFGWELKLMEWLQALFGEKLGAAIGYLSILGEGVFIVLSHMDFTSFTCDSFTIIFLLIRYTI